MEKISKYVNYIAGTKNFEKTLKRNAERRLSGPERNFASQINNMGRKAYFDEYFYGIPLNEQNIPQIPGIEDIRNTKTFKEGYQRGEFLVSVGNIPEEYQNIKSSKHR